MGDPPIHNEPDPTTLPMARAVIAPQPVQQRAGDALTQMLIVIGVYIVWRYFMIFQVMDWVEARAPGMHVYAQVFLNGVVAMLAVWLAVRGQPGIRDSLGLATDNIGREIGWGVLMVIPCYMANIIVSVLYVLASRTDIMDIASDRLENMEVLAELAAVSVVPISIYVGIYEEILFRGFFLTRLRRLFGGPQSARATALAILLSSAVFGLAHVYQGTLGVLQTFTVGIILALIAVWRRKIWACMIAHMGIDIFGLILLKFLKPLLEEALRAATQPA